MPGALLRTRKSAVDEKLITRTAGRPPRFRG
jgi:hypothetical protein